MSDASILAVESRRGRRIVGVVLRGQDLVTAIETVCRTHAIRTAELRALGSLERVELAEYDQAHRRWKPARIFDGGFEILQLAGNVSEREGRIAVHAHVTVMRDRDSGVEVLGGHLVSGRVFALEFVLEVFDDVILRRAAEPTTGLTLWREAFTLGEGSAETPATSAALATPATPADSSATAGVSPSAASPLTRVSPTPTTNPADDDLDVLLEPGDVLLHPRLGRCEVIRIEGGGDFAQIQLSTGRVVRLALDVLELRLAGNEADRRVVRARVA